MVQRIERLGGVPFTKEAPTFEDINDSFNTVIDFTGANKFVGIESNATDVQIFTTSGTWTKPSKGKFVYVKIWSAGGSGGSFTVSGSYVGGGGGGAYCEQWFKIEDIDSTETVTVGTGGASVSGDNNGNSGGTSSFGTHITATGGGGGNSRQSFLLHQARGGYGGLMFGTIRTGYDFTGDNFFGISFFRQHLYGGAGGHGASQTGGNSYYGGAGGGAANPNFFGSGGVSYYGGNGGDGALDSSAGNGSYPAGGGGAQRGSGSSGAGADGRVEVYVF